MPATTKEFTPQEYPSFPEGLPNVELETFSLTDLELGNKAVREQLFKCCKARGFFYLDFKESQADSLPQQAAEIAQLAESVFALPSAEKDKYSFAKNPGTIFGYKGQGATQTDKKGTRDTNEFFNISKDEMLGNTTKWKSPDVITDQKTLLADYVTHAHQTGLKIMSILAEELGLPLHAFEEYHRIGEEAGDHIRMTRGPPRKNADLPEIQTPGHTDFGTITILFNWLGGLQVWSESSRGQEGFQNIIDPDTQGKDQWLWVVPPKPGCAIVNLGDAAVKFTNGVLCSGRHRVVPAPGLQGTYSRYSIVYFVRPEDKAILKVLDAPGIPKSNGAEDEAITAKDWIFQQAMKLGNKLTDN